MYRSSFGLLLSLLVLSTIRAAERIPPELELIPKDTAAFVTVRYDRLNSSRLGKVSVLDGAQSEGIKNLESKWLGFPAREIERVTILLPTIPDELSERSIGMPLFVVTRNRPIDRAAHLQKLEAMPLVRDQTKELRLQDLRRGEFYRLGNVDGTIAFVGERSVLIGTDDRFENQMGLLGRLLDPSPDAPLAEAISAANGKNDFVAGMTGNTLRSLIRTLGVNEKYAGIADAQAFTIVANFEPRFHLTIRASFGSEKAAIIGEASLASWKTWTIDALKELTASVEKDEVEMSTLFLAALRAAAEPKRTGKDVTFAVDMKSEDFAKAASAGLQAAVRRIRSAADRLRASNNLKQVGLGVHNAFDTYDYHGFGKRPKEALHAGLSWRVHLLPFIEQDNLYRQFKLDEPWDSEHNKQLIKHIPKVYAPPVSKKEKVGQTYLRMFDGAATIYRTEKFDQVRDGLSNTLMVVEGGEATIWTKPDELSYDPKKPLPKLGGHFPDGFHVLFADGRVKFFRNGIDEDFLRAIITVNGGERIDLKETK